MTIKTISHFLFIILIFNDLALAKEPFRVIGYLPTYSIGSVDLEMGKYLTDIAYFSLEPNANGLLETSTFDPKTHQKLMDIKKIHGVNLILCLGGWGRSEHFNTISKTPEARKRFIASLKDFCISKSFDEVNYDWEFPEGEAQIDQYSQLLLDSKALLKNLDIKVTIAISSHGKLSKEAYEAVDYTYIMSYDHGAQHSTLSDAITDTERQVVHGSPIHKLCLGVPFYGRKMSNVSQSLTYRDLIKISPQEQGDIIDGFYFNNKDTLSKKVKYAIDSKLGGIMIWEIGQDASGDLSLLQHIHHAISSH